MLQVGATTCCSCMAISCHWTLFSRLQTQSAGQLNANRKENQSFSANCEKTLLWRNLFQCVCSVSLLYSIILWIKDKFIQEHSIAKGSPTWAVLYCTTQCFSSDLQSLLEPLVCFIFTMLFIRWHLFEFDSSAFWIFVCLQKQSR